MRSKSQDTIDQLMDVITRMNREIGRIPTITDLQNATGLARGTVANYLSHMAQQGLIEYEPRHRICIKGSHDKHEQEITMIPLAGSIICGTPEDAQQQIDEYIPFPTAFLGRGEHFFLRTYGDSMTDAKIDDGDIVLVRMQKTADYGDIVAALTVDGETTLKRLARYGDNGYCLKAENSSKQEYIDMCITEFSIQGVVVKIIKEPD